jgi:hypothetical protein
VRYWLHLHGIIQWFETGNTLKVKEDLPAAECLSHYSKVPELLEKTSFLGIGRSDTKSLMVAGCEFILEGLCSQKKISRSEEKGIYSASKRPQEPIFQNYDKYKKHYN